jgi:hypothetical protein
MTEQEQQLLQNILLWEHEKTPELAMLLVKGIDLEDKNWKGSFLLAKKFLPQAIEDFTKKTSTTPIPNNTFLDASWNGMINHLGGSLNDLALFYILYSLYPDTYQELETLDVFKPQGGRVRIQKLLKGCSINDYDYGKPQLSNWYNEFSTTNSISFFLQLIGTCPEDLHVDESLRRSNITKLNLDGQELRLSGIEKLTVLLLLSKINSRSVCVLLRDISEKLKADREVILEAVKNNGKALAYAAEDLRCDREIVMEAVKNNGKALAYAAEDLRCDREIVMEAVTNFGDALNYASEIIQDDAELIKVRFESLLNGCEIDEDGRTKVNSYFKWNLQYFLNLVSECPEDAEIHDSLRRENITCLDISTKLSSPGDPDEFSLPGKLNSLTQFNCSFNKLVTLNISKCKSLKHLDCSYNILTRLDVNENTKLIELDCRYNELSTLNLIQNKGLKTLYCGGNLIPTAEKQRIQAQFPFAEV